MCTITSNISNGAKWSDAETLSRLRDLQRKLAKRQKDIDCADDLCYMSYELKNMRENNGRI